jgi:hypothetical protein
MAQSSTDSLATVLAEAYQTAGLELSQDSQIRRRILERIAILPTQMPDRQSVLNRFPLNEVAPIANESVGRTMRGGNGFSESLFWLGDHPEFIDAANLFRRLQQWRTMNPGQTVELVLLLHWHGPDAVLNEMASDADLYSALAPLSFPSQAVVALIGLSARKFDNAASSDGVDRALLQILRALSKIENFGTETNVPPIVVANLMTKRTQAPLPRDFSSWSEFALLSRGLAARLANMKTPGVGRERAITALNSWADLLQRAIDARSKQ